MLAAALKQYALPEEHRRVLLPGVYSLMGVCSEHEYVILALLAASFNALSLWLCRFKQIHALLDSTARVLFKNLYSDYSKSFKFTGKV